MTFRDLGFNEQLIEGLEYMNFVEATPIQAEAIPLIQEGKDLIACAQTGTGKTGAFLLPLINKLSERKDAANGNVDVLIIVPTRELALQIDQQVEAFGYFSGVSSIPIYGGGDNNSYQQQKKALTKGADIIIATPGRLLSHMNLGYVKLENVKHFILDEADRMMDMGFFDDIMTVVNKLPKSRQTLFFSATMPDNIRKLSKRVLNNPEQINIALSKPAEGVTQGAFMCYSSQKVALAVSILKGEAEYPSVIIFTSTKRKVTEIYQSLSKKKIKAEMISSDLDQKEREAALIKFKNREIQVLVATDILARGIDIKEISLVINYDVPGDAEDYVHRIGRTARADSTGTAYTFITEDDQDKFFKIEKLIEATIDKLPLPAEIGEGPEYKPGTRRRGGGGYRRNGRGGGNRNNRGGGGNRNNNRSGGKGPRGKNHRGGSNRSSGNNNQGGGSNKGGSSKRPTDNRPK